MFEATAYAGPCGVSRGTALALLRACEGVLAARVLQPFHTGGATEIVGAPKAYAADSGLLCHYRGWTSLRSEDMGLLWEHFVLNELAAAPHPRRPRYWRDKRGHEVPFVLSQPGRPPAALCVAWTVKAFDSRGLAAFRRRYPHGPNFLIASDAKRPAQREFGGVRVLVASPTLLAAGASAELLS